MIGAKKSAFPDTYNALKADSLIEAFTAGPRRLRTVIDGLREEDLIARPRSGRWSIKEVVVHVADSELTGAGRIRQAYAEPGSVFAFYNQDVWTERFAYQEFNGTALEASLQLFETLRMTTAPIFGRATDRIGTGQVFIRSWAT